MLIHNFLVKTKGIHAPTVSTNKFIDDEIAIYITSYEKCDFV